MVASVGRMSLTQVKWPLPCNRSIPRAIREDRSASRLLGQPGTEIGTVSEKVGNFFGRLAPTPSRFLRASCTSSLRVAARRASADVVERLPAEKVDVVG